MDSTRRAIDAIGRRARPLPGDDSDLDPVVAMAAGRDLVLLGEASHGTHEFYAMRAAISRRLIVEQGFDAVAVEGDWPDVHRLDRHVRGLGNDADAWAALGDFDRFPRWMWRNREMLAFVDWLAAWNRERAPSAHTGLHGLDLYSLHRSARQVIDHLDRVDPVAARTARERYGCLDHRSEAQGYGRDVALGVREACREEVVAQLTDLLRRRSEALAGDADADEQFHAEMNARLVRDAEAYYRGMFSPGVITWNLRDRHMADTLHHLRQHLGRQLCRPARILVWAHNSHLGDARASEMSRHGEINLGQLVRETARERCLLVGFTTDTGTVTAARNWDAPAEQRRVRPAIEGSAEHLLARTGMGRLFLPLAEDPPEPLCRSLLERAIGVVYRPETERRSHYFHSVLAERFDCLFHLDETRALEPLDADDHWHRSEDLPETWPSGY